LPFCTTSANLQVLPKPPFFELFVCSFLLVFVSSVLA
jgi:hypothetical protein